MFWPCSIPLYTVSDRKRKNKGCKSGLAIMAHTLNGLLDSATKTTGCSAPFVVMNEHLLGLWSSGGELHCGRGRRKGSQRQSAMENAVGRVVKWRRTAKPFSDCDRRQYMGHVAARYVCNRVAMRGVKRVGPVNGATPLVASPA